jgi:hypothetical protein
MNTPAGDEAAGVFAISRDAGRTGLKDAEGRLVAVRRTSHGHFLTVRVSVAVPADVDHEPPERIAERLWWLSGRPCADRAVLERGRAAARRRPR